ncbi:hypothetical protein V6N12_044284 [Hibiscus sabdariffa]|uniref:Aconitase/3-isopropylmalate dehydratase large subunit alpha/beta/alpha domain-containing protein n=1 Tax=Hibiscus sabdariffa TaxID=183260 RepID=A0ABR2DHX0_9ROSI
MTFGDIRCIGVDSFESALKLEGQNVAIGIVWILAERVSSKENEDQIVVVLLSFYLHGLPTKHKHGSVAIVAITSCTNTSNPNVMLGTCLVTKKAYEFGLQVKPWIKINLTPGLGVATKYSFHSGLHKDSDKNGFNISGYGCTCIENSGDLDDSVANAISRNETTTFVFSENHNFENSVHALTNENYIASPRLVVAYAFARIVCIDFVKLPSETSKDGKNVEKSETSVIVEKMQIKGDHNMIGQFGVGLYFVYLLADYVEVINIHSGVEEYVWKLKDFSLCGLTIYLEKIVSVDDVNGAAKSLEVKDKIVLMADAWCLILEEHLLCDAYLDVGNLDVQQHLTTRSMATNNLDSIPITIVNVSVVPITSSTSGTLLIFKPGPSNDAISKDDFLHRDKWTRIKGRRHKGNNKFIDGKDQIMSSENLRIQVRSSQDNVEQVRYDEGNLEESDIKTSRQVQVEEDDPWGQESTAVGGIVITLDRNLGIEVGKLGMEGKLKIDVQQNNKEQGIKTSGQNVTICLIYSCS